MKITCDLKLSYVTFELEDQEKAEEFLRNLVVLLSRETKIPETTLDSVFDLTLNHNALTIKLRDRIPPRYSMSELIRLACDLRYASNWLAPEKPEEIVKYLAILCVQHASEQHHFCLDIPPVDKELFYSAFEKKVCEFMSRFTKFGEDVYSTTRNHISIPLCQGSCRLSELN